MFLHARRPLGKGLKHETRLLLLAILGPLPIALLALALLWISSYQTELKVTLTLVVGFWWWASASVLHHRIVFPLRTLANLLAALREGDFSLRARAARRDDALGQVQIEANALADVLREQRLG